MTLVFSYGTLKRGFRNHHYVKESIFRGAAVTGPESFDLVDIPSKQDPDTTYPAVVRGGAQRVAGEIFEVDEETFANIDKLEDYGVRHKREIISFENGLEAWIYINIDPSIEPIPNSKNISKTPEMHALEWVSDHLKQE